MKDARNRQPLEQINSSTTPWNFYLDLKFDKTFNLSQHIHVTVYARILNALNRKNVLNVYEVSGIASNDGVINSDFHHIKAMRTSLGEEKYMELYNAINLENGQAYWDVLGKQLYGHPRRILFGIRVSY